MIEIYYAEDDENPQLRSAICGAVELCVEHPPTPFSFGTFTVNQSGKSTR